MASGTPANGIGESVDFMINTATTSAKLSNQLISIWTDATFATRTSQLSFTGLLAGTSGTVFTINGDKSIQLTPITSTAASAITPAEGMIVFVSDTNGTFVSIGLWSYQNGAWHAL
jgi:hypothetical protein